MISRAWIIGISVFCELFPEKIWCHLACERTANASHFDAANQILNLLPYAFGWRVAIIINHSR